MADVEIVVIDPGMFFGRTHCYWRKRTKWACKGRARYAVEHRARCRSLLSCDDPAHVGQAVFELIGEAKEPSDA